MFLRDFEGRNTPSDGWETDEINETIRAWMSSSCDRPHLTFAVCRSLKGQRWAVPPPEGGGLSGRSATARKPTYRVETQEARRPMPGARCVPRVGPPMRSRRCSVSSVHGWARPAEASHCEWRIRAWPIGRPYSLFATSLFAYEALPPFLSPRQHQRADEQDQRGPGRKQRRLIDAGDARGIVPGDAHPAIAYHVAAALDAPDLG